MKKFVCFKKERHQYKDLSIFGLVFEDRYDLEFSDVENSTNILSLQVEKEIADTYQVDGEYEFNI
jgi:hypothetical protein